MGASGGRLATDRVMAVRGKGEVWRRHSATRQLLRDHTG